MTDTRTPALQKMTQAELDAGVEAFTQDANDHRCPHCGSRDTRRATAYWQCLTCERDWQGP